MILTDGAILQAIERKAIVIEPFRRECLGTNSYDVHLGKTLAIYQRADYVMDEGGSHYQLPLDCAQENEIFYQEIHPTEGYILKPGILYLGVTEEYTETHEHIPFLDGKSSIGRLGIFIHATAGRGDVGFCNFWTMELSVVQPVRVYAGMPIGQLIYHESSGTPLISYDKKPSAKYQGHDPKPQPSRMFKNFPRVSLPGGASRDPQGGIGR